MRDVLTRLRRDERRARARLLSLSAIVRATGRDLNPRQIVELAMRRIGALTRLGGWALLLPSSGHDDHVVHQASGPGLGAVKGRPVPDPHGLVRRAVARRRVAIAPAGPRPHREAPPAPPRAGMPAAALPLLSRGRVVGVMLLFGPRGGRIPEDDARLTALLLEPVAVALDSALLLRRSEELSVTDDLTKLYNSRYLNAVLRREVERSRRYRAPVSLIFLDLDGFKNVNDRHGHLCGSRTLVEVGAVIRDTVRGIDIVARFGGDEFCVVLPQTGPGGAGVIAERIRERIARTTFMQSHGLVVRITASFGIASYPDHGLTQDELIARADQAMYAAKAAGKNGVRCARRRPAGAVAS